MSIQRVIVRFRYNHTQEFHYPPINEKRGFTIKGKCDIMFPEISSCTIDDLMFKLQELNINRVELDLDFDLPELD